MRVDLTPGLGSRLILLPSPAQCPSHSTNRHDTGWKRVNMDLGTTPLDPLKKLSPSPSSTVSFRVGVRSKTRSWLTIIVMYIQLVITLLPSQSSLQVSAASSSSTSNKKDLTLYAAGFFPVSTRIPEGAIGRGVLPAVDLALQHINDSPKILPGIHLDLVYNDTEVSKSHYTIIVIFPLRLLIFLVASLRQLVSCSSTLSVSFSSFEVRRNSFHSLSLSRTNFSF